jgi:hypothetical protein
MLPHPNHPLIGKAVFHRTNNGYGSVDGTFSRVLAVVSNKNKILIHAVDLMTSKIAVLSDDLLLATEADGKIETARGGCFLYIDKFDKPHRVDGASNNLYRRKKELYFLHGVPYATMEELFSALEDEEDQMDAVFGLASG